MIKSHPVIQRTLRRLRVTQSRVLHRTEADRAAAYWASLTDYRASDEPGSHGWARSQQVVEVARSRELRSLLEVGCNSGRNLVALQSAIPGMRLKGLDVNSHALAFAARSKPGIEFQLRDAREWEEVPASWDGILTMSVLDHIPDDAVETLAADISRTARKCVICVELWDGSHGERGPYKYSRDTRALFERHGLETIQWELSAGQYDEVNSRLFIYVGAIRDSQAFRRQP